MSTTGSNIFFLNQSLILLLLVRGRRTDFTEYLNLLSVEMTRYSFREFLQLMCLNIKDIIKEDFLLVYSCCTCLTVSSLGLCYI